jgi:hypothetical protein
MFPNYASALRLICALLVNSAQATFDARYH